MIQYDGSKCDKHQMVRCVLCMAAASRGTGPQPVAITPPPAAITGGPPENIEGLSTSVRDREPVTPEEVNTEYDKILAEVNVAKAAKEAKAKTWESSPEEPTRPRQPDLGGPIKGTFPGQTVPVITFATLPVDDSHASQVVRAAAKYAEAATTFALRLAEAEKVKQMVSKAQAEQDAAGLALREAEAELKKLVGGGA
jgi:hypothetical protein